MSRNQPTDTPDDTDYQRIILPVARINRLKRCRLSALTQLCDSHELLRAELTKAMAVIEATRKSDRKSLPRNSPVG